MSSLTSSQWIPTPLPIRRQLERCLGEALNNRGNHSSGAATRRASARVTTSSSSVKETSTASATGLQTKVLIPSNDKRFPMLLNQIVEFSEFGAAKTTRFGERYGGEPKFGVTLRLLNMNVMRFRALSGEKEKAVSVDTKHLWHPDILSGESIKARILYETKHLTSGTERHHARHTHANRQT